MAQIDKPNLYFNTITYTGNGTGSTARTVGFDPDWIWVKNSGGTDSHYLMDKLRGLDYNIETDTNAAQARDYLISGTTSTAWTSSNSGEINANGGSFVAWNWKANGQGSSNTDGSINSIYTSANTTSGTSVIRYTGTGSNATVGHGLGVAPKMFFIKQLGEARSWPVYHSYLGNNKALFIDTTAQQDTDSSYWNDTNPTSTTISLGTRNEMNKSGQEYIAYCFADKPGYQKIGIYQGNGNDDGPFIYTGFPPAFVITKGKNVTDNWAMWDNKRDTQNVNSVILRPDTNAAQTGNAAYGMDFLSNGFKLKGTDGKINGNGSEYIYIAIAATAFVGTNKTPATGRSNY